jgi:hypothetical protein
VFIRRKRKTDRVEHRKLQWKEAKSPKAFCPPAPRAQACQIDHPGRRLIDMQNSQQLEEGVRVVHFDNVQIAPNETKGFKPELAEDETIASHRLAGDFSGTRLLSCDQGKTGVVVLNLGADDVVFDLTIRIEKTPDLNFDPNADAGKGPIAAVNDLIRELQLLQVHKTKADPAALIGKLTILREVISNG